MTVDLRLAAFSSRHLVNLTGVSPPDVFFAPGVRRLRGDQALANYYVEGSWIPAGRWEKIDPSLFRHLTDDPAFSIQRSISRFSMTSQACRDLSLAVRGRSFQGGLLKLGDALEAVIARAISGLAHSQRTCIVHVPQTSQPRSWTLTCDSAQPQLRIGLHIDSWEQHVDAARQTAMNRICLNLGPGHRYFVFSPITLAGMKVWLDSHQMLYSNVNEIRNTFFEWHADLPILAVRLNPGDCYLAPTENIVHDGSTFDSTSEATHIPIRGHWQPWGVGEEVGRYA